MTDSFQPQPVRVFLSYAHEDDSYRIRLEKALKLLQRQQLVERWSDRKILPGGDWAEEIDRELNRADLILLLVSDDFLHSDYCWGVEVERAMERQKEGEAVVVPVVVRASDWESAPFGKLQALPRDARPVAGWEQEDEAWKDVSKGLRRLVEQIQQRQANRSAATADPTAAPDPRRYLEALEARHSFVEIRGMGAKVAERLPLERVYTRLRVAHGAAREREGAKDDKHPPGRESGLDAGKAVELPAVLREERHAVLVGDPGSGKTTFLRFAAQVLARGLLADSAEDAERKLGLGDPLPLPIFVRLSRFAEFLRDEANDDCAPDAPEHFLRYLEFVQQGHRYGLPEGYLRRQVEAGKCFLLLDGLDEVPGALRQRVAAVVEQLVGEGGDNRHLITCRTRAYQGMSQLGGVPGFPLEPFGPADVEAFVASWSRALYQQGSAAESDGEAERYRLDLLAAVQAHPNVAPMTASPLMLTMLAVVHWNQKKLPEQRAELYDAAVEYLLDSRSDQASQPAPLRREVLQAVALAMFEHKEGVQRSLGLREAAEAATPVLGSSEQETALFLEDEALYSGLLVSRNEGELEFWHLSFQEYLAALELAASGEYWPGIREHLYDDRWNEVVLLLAGCLRRQGGGRAAQRFVGRILEHAGDDRVARARAVGLIGRVLEDVRPYGGDPAAGTGFEQALEQTLEIFQPGGLAVEEKVRIEVGEALGKVGDPRLVDPAANRVAIAGGTFLMGAQAESAGEPGFDEEAHEDEAPPRRVTLSPFAIGRYPVTVQEFAVFVDAAEEGYLNPRQWSPEGWATREKESWQRPGSWEEQLQVRNRPVTGISWYEADAYGRWIGGRLPTEAEWEWVARGVEGRRFPWGDEDPDEARANFEMSVGRPNPVGVYPHGATTEGVFDLAGNVWEWCSDWFGDYPEEDDQANPEGPSTGGSRVLRGGSFDDASRFFRAACRDNGPPEIRYDVVGFRVVFALPGALGTRVHAPKPECRLSAECRPAAVRSFQSRQLTGSFPPGSGRRRRSSTVLVATANVRWEALAGLGESLPRQLRSLGQGAAQSSSLPALRR